MKARRGEVNPWMACSFVVLGLLLIAIVAGSPRAHTAPAVEASALYRVTYPGGEVLARGFDAWRNSANGVLQVTLQDGSTALLGGTWQAFPVQPLK